GTSSVLATWNAAAYVAQIDEKRLSEAMHSGAWEDAVRRVMEREPRIWFEDEAYVIVRRDQEVANSANRSEEHTSELQSREKLVCRLLLEKKKKKKMTQ